MVSKNKNGKAKGTGKESCKYNPKSKDTKYRDKERLDLETRPSVDYNDPDWGIYDRAVAEQSTSFSFNNIIGIPNEMNLNYIGLNDWNEGPFYHTFTSHTTYRTNPSPGVTNTSQWSDSTAFALTDTNINAAARKLYTMLSANNMKTTQYQFNDIAMAILGIGELITMTELARRAFGLIYYYNFHNRNLPNELTLMCGIDVVSSDIASQRVMFNNLVTRAQDIIFPGSINYFETCKAIYQGVFYEDTSPTSATYSFLPETYWVLDEIGSPTGTVAKAHFWDVDSGGAPPTPGGENNAPHVRTMSWVLNQIKTMIDVLLESTTFQYIWADVLKYFGSSTTLFKIPLLEDTYITPMIYSEEANLQVRNATIVPLDRTDITKFNVTSNANTGYVEYTPPLATTITPYFAMDKMLRFKDNNPSLEDKVTAFRFCASCRYSGKLFNGETPATPLQFVYNGWQAILPDHYIGRYITFTYDTKYVGKKWIKSLVSNDITSQELLITASGSSATITSKDNNPVTKMIESHNSVKPLTYMFRRKENSTVPNWTFVPAGTVDSWTFVSNEIIAAVMQQRMYGLFMPKMETKSGR